MLLIGSIVSNPTVNLPAFQGTMTRVWKTERVHISQRDNGLYIAKFQLEKEKQRVADGGPWLFSGHLVIFKQWLPQTPLHWYDFTCCAFWVHVYGLPLEWSTEQLLRRAVQQIGSVVAVDSTISAGSTIRHCRVRIEIALANPLKLPLICSHNFLYYLHLNVPIDQQQR